MNSSSTFKKGAFYDVDGTLIRTNVVHVYAYYAMNRGSILGSLGRTASTVASLPIFGGLDVFNRKVFNEFFYRYYAGLTEDRLVTLAEDLFEDVIKDKIYDEAQDLIDEARRSGCKIVLVTGALDFSIMPLARFLGADDVLANKMQFVGGVATGKVIPPIIEGANKANVIRDYCVKNGMELDKSFAYSDSASDYPMLAVVGRPTAVNPDFRLRSLARAYNWPILDLK
ncbi:MAG: HAD family hydrolase [Myxococcaceae bacterium]